MNQIKTFQDLEIYLRELKAIIAHSEKEAYCLKDFAKVQYHIGQYHVVKDLLKIIARQNDKEAQNESN